MKTLAKQHEQFVIFFGNIVKKMKTVTKLVAECHGETEMNLLNALKLYSMFGFIESYLNLEQKHEIWNKGLQSRSVYKKLTSLAEIYRKMERSNRN